MQSFVDIHNREKSFHRYYDLAMESSMSPRQKDMVARFISDLRIGKFGKKVKHRRLTSYLQYLIKLQNYFGEDLDRITEKKATKFYMDLQDDRIRKVHGGTYASATKDEFIKTIKKYLGWAWGQKSPEYQQRISWMRSWGSKVQKQAITLEQARAVLRKERHLRNRCLFLFLFDSGARIEEALNVRHQDLELNTEKKFYIVHLRGTKTEDSDRTISVPLASELLNEWLKDGPGGGEDDFVFPLKYETARKAIRKMSDRVLGFPLKPHELRHSSATHYVQVFGASNIAGFYYRYGWRFGSKEANTYIKTHLYGGEVGQKKVVEAIELGRVSELEGQLGTLKGDLGALKDELEELGGGKGVLSLLLSLLKNQKKMAEVLEEHSGRKVELVAVGREAGLVCPEGHG